MNQHSFICSCIILAGGEGRRVGGRDKGLLSYKNRPLIEHVINAVQQDTDDIIISANRNISSYQSFGYPVISDASEVYRGPMAGIAACIPHCQHEWVLVVPCDMPLLTGNFAATLHQKISTQSLAIIESENKLQLCMLVNTSLHASLQQSLDNNQLRLMQWVMSQQPAVVCMEHSLPFANYNTLAKILG